MIATIQRLRSDIEAIQRDKALFEDENFHVRAEALDFLEFDVLGQVDRFLLSTGQTEELIGLRQQTQVVKTRLEEVDERLFQRIRDNIRSQNYTLAELRQQLVDCAGVGPNHGNEAYEGYDNLDALVNGLLLTGAAPEETREREPEMVFYQPTPARIVLELVEKAGFQPNDVFYDIGSGLGQVAILVHLLSGVCTKGVEFEPAYCEFARRCSRELNLSDVEFINADAREAAYIGGTAFFLYTPFEGEMLEQVLKRLRDESGTRGIRLFTHGSCTLQVARQTWLERVDHNGSDVNGLAIFRAPRKH